MFIFEDDKKVGTRGDKIPLTSKREILIPPKWDWSSTGIAHLSFVLWKLVKGVHLCGAEIRCIEWIFGVIADWSIGDSEDVLFWRIVQHSSDMWTTERNKVNFGIIVVRYS